MRSPAPLTAYGTAAAEGVVGLLPVVLIGVVSAEVLHVSAHRQSPLRGEQRAVDRLSATGHVATPTEEYLQPLLLKWAYRPDMDIAGHRVSPIGGALAGRHDADRGSVEDVLLQCLGQRRHPVDVE